MFPIYCSKCSRMSSSDLTPGCSRCGTIETRTAVGNNFNPTEPQAPRQFGTVSGPRSQHRLDGIYNNFPNSKESDTRNNALQELENLIKTSLQNCPSNTSSLQSTQNENPQIKISNFEASKGKSIHSLDDSLAVPGPSGFHQNKNTSNLPKEKFQPGSSLELQSVALTDEKTVFCVICRWEIDGHSFEYEGKTFYGCCNCTYKSSEWCILQEHASIHDPKFLLCDICGEFDFDKDAHDSEKTCKVCQEIFQCRTLLEQHSLVHENYYFYNCMLCRDKIDDHFVPKESLFKCCDTSCAYKIYRKAKLINHLYIHTDLKLFKCDVCGRRFTQKNSLYGHLHIHFKCKKCGKTFTSKERLEVHFKQEHAQASADRQIKNRQ